ncbi:MAG TPA: hypothetical protein VJ464_08085 [Blastocatellia bacterium]|nr:hypothetical protein [Blastocatellia bacterium]
MEKNSVTLAAPPGALATRNRQLFMARIFVLALVLALSLLSLQPQTSARAANQKPRAVAPDCAGDCEQARIQCQLGGGSLCDIQYNNCISGCH